MSAPDRFVGQLSSRDHMQRLCLDARVERKDFVTVATAFYRLANRAAPIASLAAASVLFAVVLASIDPALRAGRGAPVFGGDDALVAACIATSTLILFTNAPFVVLFLGTTALQSFRKYTVLSWFARLTRLNREQHIDFPHLCLFRSPHDAVVWVQGRAVFGTFAFRYERRAEIYLLIVSGVAALSLIRFFLALFSGDAARLRQANSTWALLVFTVPVFLSLVASSVYAALANEVCEGAIAGLAHGRLRIRARALAGGACEQHLSAAEEVLAIASDQLDIINRANDARVLGVRADLSVVISLVTAGLSAYVFVLFLLFDVST